MNSQVAITVIMQVYSDNSLDKYELNTLSNNVLNTLENARMDSRLSVGMSGEEDSVDSLVITSSITESSRSSSLACTLCGEEYETSTNGINNHIGADGKIDSDADAHHTPY